MIMTFQTSDYVYSLSYREKSCRVIVIFTSEIISFVKTPEAKQNTKKRIHAFVVMVGFQTIFCESEKVRE